MSMQELGLDCVAWAPAVYHDLLRSGDGTAEGIVAAYFGMVSASPSYSQYALQTSLSVLFQDDPLHILAGAVYGKLQT